MYQKWNPSVPFTSLIVFPHILRLIKTIIITWYNGAWCRCLVKGNFQDSVQVRRANSEFQSRSDFPSGTDSRFSFSYTRELRPLQTFNLSRPMRFICWLIDHICLLKDALIQFRNEFFRGLCGRKWCSFHTIHWLTQQPIYGILTRPHLKLLGFGFFNADPYQNLIQEYLISFCLTHEKQVAAFWLRWLATMWPIFRNDTTGTKMLQPGKMFKRPRYLYFRWTNVKIFYPGEIKFAFKD